jgi:hypothetical protein
VILSSPPPPVSCPSEEVQMPVEEWEEEEDWVVEDMIVI